MRTKFRALGVAALLAGAIWFLGCDHYVCNTTFGGSSCQGGGGGLGQGTGGGGVGQIAFVYFINNSNLEMAAEAVNFASSGTFAPISSFVTPSFSGSSGATSALTIVNKKYLYAAFTGGTVFAFSINSGTAALTPIGSGPYVAPTGATAMTADPAGRFLFVGGTGGIAVYTINADGSLAANSQSPFSTGGVIPVSMATDGLGKFLYAADGARVVAFTYDQSAGTLTEVAGSPFSGSDFALIQVAGEGTGKYLLGVTGFTDSVSSDKHLYVFNIAQIGSSAPGALSPATGSPLATTYAPAALAVSASGNYVYTFNETTTSGTVTLDPIEGFAFDSSTGALTELSTSPFATLAASNGQFDQSDSYLVILGQETNATQAGTIAVNFDPTSGNLNPTLPAAGAPSDIFAVTDEP